MVHPLLSTCLNPSRKTPQQLMFSDGPGARRHGTGAVQLLLETSHRKLLKRCQLLGFWPLVISPSDYSDLENDHLQ